MNLTVLSTAFPAPLPSAVFQALLDKLPANLQQTILKFRKWEDAHASLLGKYLLQTAMLSEGFSPSLDRMRYSDHRRPYFDQHPDFNISHSGHRVICIVNPKGPVGIDLEVIAPIAVDDFQSQFSPTEWAHIQTAEHPLTVFYHYWTAKESLIKADGRGLSIPLASLEIVPGVAIPLAGRNWWLHRVPLPEGYIGHLACESPLVNVEVRELEPLSWLTV